MVSPDSLADASSLYHASVCNSGLGVNETAIPHAALSPNGNLDASVRAPITELKIYNNKGTKQPSYVGLACCISGYTTLTTYDSKEREGFRSRDISPSRIIVSREVSPVRSGCNAHSCSYTSECGNYLSPHPLVTATMHKYNGNGGQNLWNGSSDTNREVTNHITTTTSTKTKREQSSYTRVKISSSDCAKVNKMGPVSLAQLQSFPSASSSSHRSASHSSISNAAQVTELSERTSPPSSSFILQRVERLYGPGALAQGFYSPRRSTSNNPPQESASEKFGNKSSEASLPVLKLLRPEFRAQLSVGGVRGQQRKLTTSSPFLQRSAAVMESVDTEACGGDTTVEATSTQQVATPVLDNQLKDGHYYLKIVHDEMNALERLAGELESLMEIGGTPDEFGGRLRAAIGKARLLGGQKLSQFEGLCHKNISQDCGENFPTTNDDLAGFWDMVSIQVRSVHNEFKAIEALRLNNWMDSTAATVARPATDKVSAAVSNGMGASKKPKPKKLSSEPAPSASSKVRDEARRRMLEEKRKALRQNKLTSDDQLFVVT